MIHTKRDFSSCSVCLAKAQRNIKEKANEQRPQPSKGGAKSIVIPRKIERSSTAILEALASTVRADANQPMYMDIDDPHLLSTADRLKKNHMAAKDSGRKAAQTMLALYPDYFTQIWEEPLPETLNSPFEGYKYQEASEAALIERIQKRQVKDAIEVYKSCKASDYPLSQESQEQLLELLTVFNSKEPDRSSALSNFINPSFALSSPFPACTWEKGNLAEQVYNSLPEKTPTAYCLLLRGMAANFDKEGALTLYNEMKVANVPVDVSTYNKLLSLASLDAASMDEITQTLESILQDMKAAGVQPNVGTFNCALSNCRRISKWTGARKYALSLVAEMKACGLEPELSTFYELMHIFYYVRDKSSKTPELFENILDYMDGKEYTLSSENDALFFRNAMKVIATFFPDSKLALKLHRILKFGQNSKALGHRQLVFTYYKELLSVVTPLEHTDVVMDLYQSIAPYIFLPSSDTYRLILENIEMHDTHHYLPQLFADLFWTSQFKDTEMLGPFVHAMATQKHSQELQQQFSDITSTLLESWEQNRERRDNIGLDGSVIGDMILIYINNNEPKKAMSAFRLYLDDKSLHQAEPGVESLTKLTEHSIAVKDYKSTGELLTMMLSTDSSNVPGLVEQVLKSTELSDQERNYLQGLAQEASSESSSSDSDSD
ncbi:pentatricopeptide repeat domain-containing protein 3, mitochondrial isoform X2 [Aplysia californica]|uniref:Small ribosomal subunit protein mS39 n=1 Tax=Aplysia californica TaxID=6500 RepID=A0ABM1W2F5_APLCA|nr:pentatricopeptide repeat domain-containing protein 3, mitochondrial isoform X2 [Aplysia californica]